MKTRKTITFKEEIYEAIQKWRLQMWQKSGMEFNFTEAVNHLIGERLRKKK